MNTDKITGTKTAKGAGETDKQIHTHTKSERKSKKERREIVRDKESKRKTGR